MKISALIHDLQVMQNIHGDVECITSTKTVTAVDGCHIKIDAYATDLMNGIWIEEESALILNLEWKK